MVNWWFGSRVVWIPEILFMNGSSNFFRKMDARKNVQFQLSNETMHG